MAASNLAQTRKFHPRLSMMSQYQSEEAKQWELDEIEGNLYSAGCMWDELKETTYPSGPSPCAFSVVGLSHRLPFLVYCGGWGCWNGDWKPDQDEEGGQGSTFSPLCFCPPAHNVTASPLCQRLARGRALQCLPALTHRPPLLRVLIVSEALEAPFPPKEMGWRGRWGRAGSLLFDSWKGRASTFNSQEHLFICSTDVIHQTQKGY